MCFAQYLCHVEGCTTYRNILSIGLSVSSFRTLLRALSSSLSSPRALSCPLSLSASSSLELELYLSHPPSLSSSLSRARSHSLSLALSIFLKCFLKLISTIVIMQGVKTSPRQRLSFPFGALAKDYVLLLCISRRESNYIKLFFSVAVPGIDFDSVK